MARACWPCRKVHIGLLAAESPLCLRLVGMGQTAGKASGGVFTSWSLHWGGDRGYQVANRG